MSASEGQGLSAFGGRDAAVLTLWGDPHKTQLSEKKRKLHWWNLLPEF